MPPTMTHHKFIKLHVETAFKTTPWARYFNVARIESFSARPEGGTWVTPCQGGEGINHRSSLQVVESPEEILELINQAG